MAINVNVADLATLGLVIDDSGALRAANSIDRLGAAGSRTERVLQKQTATAATMNKQFEHVDVTAGRGRLAVGKLSQSFGSLAAQMSGAHPVMANLLGVLGSFAIGSVIMTGVLLGLAALAKAYSVLTSAGKVAREEMKKVVDSLLEQSRAARLATVEGQRSLRLALGMQETMAELELAKARRGRRFAIADPFGFEARRIADAEQDLANIREAQAQQQANMDEDELRRTEELKKAREAAAREAAAIAAASARTIKEYNDAMAESAKASTRAFWGFIEALRALRLEQEKRRSDQYEARQEKLDPEIAESARIAGENAKAVTDAAKYQREIAAIWRQGIGKIATDGTKSFADFFENVLGMFSRLMTKMEEGGKNSGGLYKALGVGSAAIGGGFAGYQTGQQTGSAMLGAFSGAMVGNSLMPGVGAVVGGLAGFATGLLGAASAARQAAKEMAALKESVKIAVLGLRAEVGGAAERLAVDLQQQRSRTAALANDIAKTGGFNLNAGGIAAIGGGDYERVLADLAKQSGAWARQLEEVIRLGMQIEQQPKERYERELAYAREDLNVRLLRAQGLDKEAEAMEKALRHERERADLIRSFGSEIDATEAATLALLDQVHAQEKLKKATDAANSSALNWVDGYRTLQDVIFDSMFPRGGTRPSGPIAPPDGPRIHPELPPIEIPVTLVMPDGRVLAQTTVRTLQGSAQAQFGDSTRWSEVQ